MASEINPAKIISSFIEYASLIDHLLVNTILLLIMLWLSVNLLLYLLRIYFLAFILAYVFCFRLRELLLFLLIRRGSLKCLTFRLSYTVQKDAVIVWKPPVLQYVIISPLCNAEDFSYQIVTKCRDAVCKVQNWWFLPFIYILFTVRLKPPQATGINFFIYTEKFNTLGSFICNHC